MGIKVAGASWGGGCNVVEALMMGCVNLVRHLSKTDLGLAFVSTFSEKMWGFPKIRGTFLGIPIIRIIVFGGLYWGSSILGNCHVILPWQKV